MVSLYAVLHLLGLALGHPSGGPGHGSLTVSTSSGKIHGKIDSGLPNVAQYLGIPFAKHPIGDLRWAAPQPLSQPDAQIEATKLPPSCMQYLTDQGNSLYVRDVLEFNLQGLNRTGAISEDCLTLSVWAPADHSKHGWNGHNSKGLPVLIFFYGGGFSTGGQDVPYQIPAQWVNRTPNHIVVVLSYRLNIFGFPNAAGLDQQNLGLLDQRAAVVWAKENIAAFGGDPGRMVIWGQSAGSRSVDLYNFAYPDDPIATGLIMDSGTAQRGSAVDVGYTNFTFVANNVGCAGLAGQPAQQLECMRGVDADTIEHFFATYQESGVLPAIAFNPRVDGVLVFSNYTERALAGLQAEIPAIVGTNAQDGVAFAPYTPDGPNATTAQQLLLSRFFCPATETVRLRQLTGRETYRYIYAGNFSNIAPRPWMGAYHSSELPLIMGTHPNYRGPSTPLEYATSHAFQDAYVAFASDPEHGLAARDWLPYGALGEADVREFGGGFAAQDVGVASDESQCDGAMAAS